MPRFCNSSRPLEAVALTDVESEPLDVDDLPPTTPVCPAGMRHRSPATSAVIHKSRRAVRRKRHENGMGCSFEAYLIDKYNLHDEPIDSAMRMSKKAWPITTACAICSAAISTIADRPVLPPALAV